MDDDRTTDERIIDSEDVKESIEAGAYMESFSRHSRAVDAILSMSQRFTDVSRRHARAPRFVRTGLLAEEHHAGTFNIDAAHKGRPDLAAYTAGIDPVADIHVSKNGEPVASAQSKYHGTAEKTAEALSRRRYNGLQKPHPSDQNVKEVAKQAGSRGNGSTNFPDTAANATDRLHFEQSRASHCRKLKPSSLPGTQRQQ